MAQEQVRLDRRPVLEYSRKSLKANHPVVFVSSAGRGLEAALSKG
jgi:hypothetical protein